MDFVTSLLFSIVNFIIGIFIVRFHTSGYQLGYNPIVERLIRFTEPLTVPFRRLLPRTRFDSAVLIPAIIIAILSGLVTLLTNGIHTDAARVVIFGVLNVFLMVWVQMIFWAVIIAVIGSWLGTDSRQDIFQIVLSCCSWLIEPVRKILPPLGMLDFSPLVVLFGLSLVQKGLASLVIYLLFGAH